MINLLDWKATDDCSMDGELPLIWTKAWITEESTALQFVAMNGNEAPLGRLHEPMAALPAKVSQGMTAGDRIEKSNKDTVLPLLGGIQSRD